MGLIQEYSPRHDMDQFAYEDILRDTSSHPVAICHDIDIEGVVEERVVEGKMMSFISNVIIIIYLYYNITYS